MKYIIRLKPLTPFYFGGETTFGDNSTQNYFVHSEVMPQASTILGVMRYMVLKVNDSLIKEGENPADKYEEREKLIGKGSFSIDKKEEQTYGVIHSISPVYVEKGRELVLMPCPVDFGLTVSFDETHKVSGNKGEVKSLPVVMHNDDNRLFDYKNYDNWMYWMDNNGNKISSKDIFCDTEQIGIKKGETQKDDKGFYKQTFKRFASADFEFVFSADMEDSKFETITSNGEHTDIVQMGGQRSMFCISISRADKTNTDPIERFNENDAFLSTDKKVVLLSEAYLSQEAWESFDFVWGESVCNRYIISTTNSRWHKPKKTEALYHLLSRGSVIFHSDIAEVKRLLEANANLTKVGLNKYTSK